MTIWIAHRGNRFGPNPDRENAPDYLQESLDAGFHVEVDVWWRAGYYFLGHDEPAYIGQGWLEGCPKRQVWCHAKDPDTMLRLLRDGYHCFFHDRDHIALTSHGYLWTYPGMSVPDRRAIQVLRDEDEAAPHAAGYCTDWLAT